MSQGKYWEYIAKECDRGLDSDCAANVERQDFDLVLFILIT
jgi:hypothetical protein